MGAWIWLAALLTLLTCCSALVTETCSAKKDFLEVEPDADVKIGVLLDVHARGEGLYGCGEATIEGVQAYEAMRLAVSLVNQKTGIVNGRSVTDSLIPGIKIGLKVYDSCGRRMAAADQLVDLFPVLKSGPENCDAMNSTLLLGAIDLTGISSNPEIAEVSRDLYVPVLPVTAESSDSPEQVAKVLAEAAHDMEWQRVAVIHAEDEHSIHVTKLLSQVATTGRLCITSVHSIPNVDSTGRNYNQPEFRVYKKVLSSVASRLQDNIGVLVVANGKPLHRLIKVMAEAPEVVIRLQWLFSGVPEAESLTALGNLLNSKRIYSLTPFPGKIQRLEDHWSSLGVLESVTPEDRWFVELVMALKNCRLEGFFPHSQLPVCSNLILAENPVDSLKRTSRSAPAMVAVYTFVNALEKAWKAKCQGRPGVCAELRSMTRMEFGSQFLDPLDATGHGADFRGPPELNGQKERTGRSEESSDGKRTALSRYSFTYDKQVDYRQVIAYDSRTAEVQDPSFTYLPSKCLKEGCNDCVKLREPRLDNKQGDHPGGLLIGRAEDVVVPLLLPIHKAGLNPLECSSLVNQEAIQDLEAALWAIDRINADHGFLSGVRLSALVVDTCSSSLKVSQKLSDFLATAALTTGVPDLTSFLAAVASGSAEQVTTVMSILSAVNITTLSATDVTSKSPKLGLESYSFQIAVKPETQARAMIEILHHQDWDYVSVIYGRDKASQKAFEAFKTAAKVAGICMGLEQPFDSSDVDEANRVVSRLHKAQQKGASAVVLMTDTVAVRAIMTAAQRAMDADVLRHGDLVWFGSGEWSHDLGVIQGLESVAQGALLFSPHQADISEFVSHFRKLKPETNKRNPYFTEFWQQTSRCKGTNCAGDQQLVNYRPGPSAGNVIQSVLSAATSLSVLRNSLCHEEEGICPKMLRDPSIRQIYNRHIQFTASVRPDGKGDMFAFTLTGSGNTPVDIFNFKKVAGNSYVYQKIGFYQSGLSSLLSAVTYGTNGEEVDLSTIKSRCHTDCGRCNRKTTDFLVLESPDNLYLAATFGLHQPTTNPLVCNQQVAPGDLQSLEAFLWALDQVNSDSKILPRLKLGGVVFDSCSSREKGLRDVSNFLSSTLSSSFGGFRLPGPDGLMGFIPSDVDDAVIRPLVDVVTPLKITTVSPTAASSSYNDVSHYPYLLRLSLPNDVVARSLVVILKYFKWDYVSVVYSSEEIDKKEVFEVLEAECKRQDINIALVEKMPKLSDSWSQLTDTIASRLALKQQEGARATILLLNPNQTTHLLAAAKRLQNAGRLKTGDLLWITVDNIQAFHVHPELSLGAISLKSVVPAVPIFKQYFNRLTLRNNTRNPWFRKYWEQVFECRGSACFDGPEMDLRQFTFKQDPRVPGVVEAVFALAHGLDRVRRQICGDNVATMCPEMMENQEVRELLFNVTKDTSFVRSDSSVLVFGNENYARGSLEVFNFRQVGNTAHAFIEVGRYSTDQGLFINTSLVRGYDERGREVQLYELKSHCQNSQACPSQRSQQRLQSTMEINAGQKFSIGALMPLHRKGSDLFSCGALDDKRMFQNMVGLMYAVDRVNANKTLLPTVQLAALVIDYCDQKQRAEEKLFSYFSEDGESGRAKVEPKSVVAMLTFDDDVSSGVTSILEAKNVPQINNPAASRTKRSLPNHPPMTFRTVPNTMGQVHTVLSILEHFGWKYVYVVHGDNEFGKSAHWEFVKRAKTKRICVDGALEIAAKTSPSKLPAILQQGLTDSRAKIVVFLTDDPYMTRQVLQTAKDISLLPRFVWIGTEGWGQSSLAAEVLEGSGGDVLAVTIKLESYDLLEFKTYFAGLTPGRHDPIPDTWFEEFWQHYFRCRLSNSGVIQMQYPEECSGEERLRPEDIDQDKYVYHTVAAVNSVAGALHEFLRTSCLHGDSATSVEDCGEDARMKLSAVIRRVLMGHELTCVDCVDESAFGYEIFQLRNGSQGSQVYAKIGLWKDGVAQFDKEAFVGEVPASICQGECVQCSEQFENEDFVQISPRNPIHANFKTVWGIIVTALSVLGIVLVVICSMYFLMAFPISVGTTVLGYMILFGLLILYSVNFAFIVSPTEGTCGIRRFVMGFAYSIIFSGMLVKVLNTWRLMGYNGNRMMTDGTRMSSPAGLLVVSVGLVIIQVVLTVAWLVLMPPKIGIYDDTWRCAPPNSFEDELVISLVYVMLLLVVTILFSILTWKCQDNNRESRWILACCLFVGLVWLAWTVLSTQLPLHFRDATIVVANLLCATLVMLCLYLRKVYLYSKLTRQIKDRDLKDHLKSAHYQQSMYGTLNKNISGVAPVLYGSQASLTGKPFYGGSFAHTTLDETPSETGGSTSSGSVQVQGTDLYPLEMYDGGSQLSLYGNKNMLVLDDAVVYSR